MSKDLVTATDSNFDELLKSKEPLLVDFWAEWCGPCRMIAPTIDELAKEYAGKLIVAKLNVDDNPASAGKYMVMSIPTLIFFKNGEEVDKIVGVVSKEELKNKIDNLL
jgi:thioredoxin 1